MKKVIALLLAFSISSIPLTASAATFTADQEYLDKFTQATSFRFKELTGNGLVLSPETEFTLLTGSQVVSIIDNGSKPLSKVAAIPLLACIVATVLLCYTPAGGSGNTTVVAPVIDWSRAPSDATNVSIVRPFEPKSNFSILIFVLACLFFLKKSRGNEAEKKV